MKPVYFQGLKKRPLFGEIAGYLETKQQMMKYPDRTATRIKDSRYFTNLDGQGGMSLADQAEKGSEREIGARGPESKNVCPNRQEHATVIWFC